MTGHVAREHTCCLFSFVMDTPQNGPASCQSLHSRVLCSSIALYQTLMLGEGALPRWTRELLAVVVSRANGCFCGTKAHGDDLRAAPEAAGLDVQLSQVAMDDYRQAELDPALRSLLDFAVQVTRDPYPGSKEAVDVLRHAGWSDAVVLEAVEIIGFFSYYNRLVDALGVEPELEWSETRPPQEQAHRDL